VLTDPAPWARELRHVTPSAGVLPAAERAHIYKPVSRSGSRSTSPVCALIPMDDWRT
jgi:hypothetical protein